MRLNFCAGRQRESLWLSLYHLLHWNPLREVITFNDFLHIAIKIKLLVVLFRDNLP